MDALKTTTIDPRSYLGVMVSGTFTDLKNHRQALIRAINSQQMKAVAMEDDSAKPAGDVIDSSLQMVRDSAAYVGVISHKYGQIPECPDRNPQALSLTELEFNEAQRLGRPVLIFIMGDDHEVKLADVERIPENTTKLEAFRENVKLVRSDSSLRRIYKEFNSLQEFEIAAAQSISNLRQFLEENFNVGATQITDTATLAYDSYTKPYAIPTPPALYAAPPYIGSHAFVGRTAQLETLNEWASPADTNPLLLYEAIGGTGKSFMVWEWTTKHAVSVRDDWAGRFWYSFYEKGATMIDFCRKLLAYMTGRSRPIFRDRNTAELTELLINQTRDRPWLIVLDGLERILVSYHRFDAAQLLDENAGTSDAIAERDPCATVNPEDEDLLRGLAGAFPSKILITSRLVPRALLNRSGQPIPGALRERLPGLRPADAELLITECGVTGSSTLIQDYLKTHCDCHPLVIGVLAGLITDYFPDRGNFDPWVVDPAGGGKLNLAKLDLVQKRNHILLHALMALPENGRTLLATLALLSSAVDYPTLSALNPDLPLLPPLLEYPNEPESLPNWNRLSEEKQHKIRLRHQETLEYVAQAQVERQAEREALLAAATSKLSETVKDLERRGLLQYDALSKRYDLHPVVRGFAAGGLKHDEINQLGQRVVDYFSQRAQNPYAQAKGLEDFDNAMRIVAALFRMGKLKEAKRFILANNFLETLNFKFEAHNEILTILRPFFAEDWSQPSSVLKNQGGISITKKAAVALRRIRAYEESFSVSELGLKIILETVRPEALQSQLLSLSSTAGEQNRLKLEDRLLYLAEDLASIFDRRNYWVAWLLARFRQLSILGDFAAADAIWSRLNSMNLIGVESAVAAHHRVLSLFLRRALTEEELRQAEELNQTFGGALGIRNLHGLRGFWRLELSDWNAARDSLQKAVFIAHKAGKVDRRAEICLAIANFKLKKLPNPHQVADDFARTVEGHCQRHLAELWLTTGNKIEATRMAILAYQWAQADGGQFVRRYEKERCLNLIQQLDIEPAPVRSSAHDTELSWESDLIAFIEQLRMKSQIGKQLPGNSAHSNSGFSIP